MKGIKVTDEQRLNNDNGAKTFKSFVDFKEKSHQEKMRRQSKKKKRK